MDQDQLQPGTPSWQSAIRAAIDDSVTVVVLASPEAGRSSYVQAEVAIASKRRRPVLPLWLAGRSWTDCVPLELTGYQFVDCRGERYDDGVQLVVERLRGEFAKQHPRLTFTKTRRDHPARVSVKLPDRDGYVSIFRDGYTSLQSMLDELYLNHLAHRYAPGSYGKEWILREVGMPDSLEELIVPWSWIIDRGRASGAEPGWASEPVSSWRLTPDRLWRVCDEGVSEMFVVALAVKDPRLLHMHPYELAKRLLTSYYGHTIGPVEPVDPTRMHPGTFPWKAVLACDPGHLAEQLVPFAKDRDARLAAFVQTSELTNPAMIV